MADAGSLRKRSKTERMALHSGAMGDNFARGRTKQGSTEILRKSKIKNRGVAQLVARLLWEQDAAGSNPVTPTKILTESRVYSPLSVIFYAYLGILPPLLKNAFLRPHHQMWTENSFIFVYSSAIFDLILFMYDIAFS